MKYIKPKSLTWWASMVPLVAGLVVASEPLHLWSAGVETINQISGGIPAVAMINAGIAGIGLRAAVK